MLIIFPDMPREKIDLVEYSFRAAVEIVVFLLFKIR